MRNEFRLFSQHLSRQSRWTCGSQPFLNQAPLLSSKNSQAPPQLLQVIGIYRVVARKAENLKVK